MYIPVFGIKFYNHFKATILVSLACSALSGTTLAANSDFKTFDMMGFDFVPTQHRNKGLEKIPVLYQCSMFRADHIRGVNYCNNIDMSEPNTLVIQQRAAEYLGVPMVAIDIEGGTWNLQSHDLAVVTKAVEHWRKLLRIWRKFNPDTTILIYGGMPRIYWALITSDQELLDLYEDKTRIITKIFSDKKVALWPSAYVVSDRPDIFRAERKWQIDICHNVYKTKCYFAIMPQFKNYTDSKTGFRLHMDQNSFLEIMTSLKEDGADGFGLWIHPKHLASDFEYRRKVWSWAGGATGRRDDKDLMWMSALEKFLDANSKPTYEPDSATASYCIDSILATAAYSCPAMVSQRLENWDWLKRYGNKTGN
jgi:hypothetical protein